MTAATGEAGEPPAGEAAGERRATWFELFCDLVFVAAVGQVTHRVGGHPTLGSVAGAAALFVPVWWLWVVYTTRANRFDPDDLVHRMLTMVGMAAVAGVTVFVGGVGHGGRGTDAAFAVMYVAARAVIVATYAVAARHDALFRPILRSFGAGTAATSALWIGGVFLPSGPARYGVWAAAMLAELALPFLARRRISGAPVDTEHLRERFGLFTIIVIGEAVLGLTNGLAASPRATVSSALTGAAAFAVCGGLWWTYFNASSTRRGSHEAMAERQSLRDAYVFGHLPAQLGLALAGAALGIAVAGDEPHVPTAAAACLLGGVGLFYASSAAVRAAFTGPREPAVLTRLLTALAFPALIPLAPHVPVAVLLFATAALIAGTVLIEAPAHRRRVAVGEAAAAG
ncbi:low temperature requirement protein A [Yinghuangia seranimata]|uniref:low temperature requirement protein A n=1 Tax=Yinghuangia seranimata TaxID=408067 RepID=UPI00248D3925|nr:low temperature requirement protein A [Yinghuangia seranimata]MDI2125801.1 low temperature requirement protein A [Yinghuangia seranimata]